MPLPPDLRDWVPEGDLVHFVIEAVEKQQVILLLDKNRLAAIPARHDVINRAP